MQRMNELLIKDKFTNLEQVACILKEEISPICKNFFEMPSDVVVRFRRDGGNFVFNIEIEASRVKPFGGRF